MHISSGDVGIDFCRINDGPELNKPKTAEFGAQGPFFLRQNLQTAPPLAMQLSNVTLIPFVAFSMNFTSNVQSEGFSFATAW
jgi:hypothetical protein